MTSLTSQIDRFSRNAKAIKATAASTVTSHSNQRSIPGPFISAVLHTHLGDLIRDIDPLELGLFSLISPTPSHFREQDAQGAPTTEVARTEFPAPTPLRKPASQREVPKPNDVEPEIYAQAALKYIDRYQTIRPMPRAHSQVIVVLERLGVVRKNIQSLNDMLQQTQSTGPLPSKKLTEDEDRHLLDLQSRAIQLKKRKQIAITQQNTLRSSHKPYDMPKPEAASQASPHEDKFWNTPVVTARTLRFTENLLDEEMEEGDISEISLSSPKTPSIPDSRSSPRFDIEEDSENNLHHNDLGVPSPQDHCGNGVQSDKCTISNNSEEDRENQQDRRDGLDAEGDNLAVQKTRVASQPAVSDVDLVSPILGPSLYGAVGTKIRVNSEVERIVARIWATAGEVIMPGHPFDTTIGNKPPRGKETIAHLQSLSVLSPSPVSPSPSSISLAPNGIPAFPTSQQILTAYLLLLLLASPPQFSMPLSKVKDMLASKARAGSSSISTGQGSARILYGCVAKRLIKIERGGGEQIVRFDI